MHIKVQVIPDDGDKGERGITKHSMRRLTVVIVASSSAVKIFPVLTIHLSPFLTCIIHILLTREW